MKVLFKSVALNRKEMCTIYTYWEGVWRLSCLGLDLDWHYLNAVSPRCASISNVDSVTPEVDARHYDDHQQSESVVIQKIHVFVGLSFKVGSLVGWTNKKGALELSQTKR